MKRLVMLLAQHGHSYKVIARIFKVSQQRITELLGHAKVSNSRRSRKRSAGI